MLNSAYVASYGRFFCCNWVAVKIVFTSARQVIGGKTAFCISQVIGLEDRLQNDLQCVEQVVTGSTSH